ncbi:hypothetical protein [Solibacillus sp. CAU 1738]|uniref:hypothetical protein n=1 Tax=Solibacillus sp. CAU 1738 TaxID=3140363 RepID=UPI0032618E5A
MTIATLLTDEMLRYVYSSAMFQQLTEQEQHAFLCAFQDNKLFANVLEIAMSINQSIAEVEAIMPVLLNKDSILTAEKQMHLKSNTTIEGNVIYYPFEQKNAPYVVCLQHLEDPELRALSIGLLLPLFSICTGDCRDLVIIPFSEEAEVLTFECGKPTVDGFQKLLNNDPKNQTVMYQALTKSIEITGQLKNAEIFIITNNQIADYKKVVQHDFSNVQAEISVIALSESKFEQSPLPFAQKIFFALQ